MWGLTRIEGTTGSGSECFVWKAELSARSLAEKSSYAKRGIEVRYDPATEKWVLKATGHPSSEHASIEAGLEAGRVIAVAAENALRADAYATTGLSERKWRFDGFGFESLSDSDDRIWPSANGWQARIGWVKLEERATAKEAEETLDRTEHLPSKQLRVLDHAYARTCHGWSSDMHAAVFALETAGFVKETENDGESVWSITAKGIEALDADPRSIPVKIREIVFRKGADMSEDMSQDQLRAEWNSWFGTYMHSGENAAGLLMALENEFELREGQVESDPCEIAVFAEGEFADGTRLGRDFSVILLSPWWSDDTESSRRFARAVVESRQDLIDAFKGREAAPIP